ncbi:ATP-binding protein [Patescibacteria group bacterium]|nr:ATP-binding protein [Patescibacteria group bacterium]MBU1663607.1 ATP-binding protein [Patescibacteria group bacterium]MBU1934129.1 ATP-binding protein [Patescibacteria group bacterium]MBU2007902.1 ATP-binding protein [Patescibacteria group bacterium]MBU2233591.1 ATP-binding protein [Patescibacteria group bacterium]
MQNIKITVDKSHIFTLGEKMYRESIEFIRELVNNAYDADATEVFVNINDNKIVIEDDGSGMNENGMEQFFIIGNEEKKIRNVSPRFGRKRIGQFGIGKFSALSLAEQFIIQSVKGKYKYSVTFDKDDWQKSEHWSLPITKEEISPFDKEGTRVILNKLTKKISLNETEKYLKQSVPIRAKKFSIYLNNKKITAKFVTGKIIPIQVKTLYGQIEGEIIIALNSGDVDEPGIECRVKQVFIKRSLFGLDKKYHQGIARITGNVNADFLPLISSRSDFIIDSPEYKLFYQLMNVKLDVVLSDIKNQRETKNIKKITKELQEVMQNIRESLSLNPDFIPQGKAVTRLKKQGKQEIAAAGINLSQVETDKKNNLNQQDSGNQPSEKQEDKKEQEEEKEKIDVKPLIMKKIRLQKLGISCGIVSLGEQGPEVVSQGNAVYINQDHPIYQKFYKIGCPE